MTTDRDARSEPPRSEPWEIRLYVAGRSARADRALENLEAICREHLSGDVHIEVVDLLERPQLAEDEQIFAVPTAIRRLPTPVRKVIGDLSDTERALVGLDIRSGD